MDRGRGRATMNIRQKIKFIVYMRAKRDGAARAIKSKERKTGPAFDEVRPTMTDDGTITIDEQRKALEYLLSPASKKRRRGWSGFTIPLTRKVSQECKHAGGNPN